VCVAAGVCRQGLNLHRITARHLLQDASSAQTPLPRFCRPHFFTIELLYIVKNREKSIHYVLASHPISVAGLVFYIRWDECRAVPNFRL
jgi:hypothetical protein